MTRLPDHVTAATGPRGGRPAVTLVTGAAAGNFMSRTLTVDGGATLGAC